MLALMIMVATLSFSSACGQPKPLELAVVLDQANVAHGATEPAILRGRLILTNPNPEPVKLIFRSSQRYDLEVFVETGQRVLRWSEDMAFAMVIGEEQLPPGSKEYPFALRLVAQGKPLPPGRYKLRAWITGEQKPEATAQFVIVEAK